MNVRDFFDETGIFAKDDQIVLKRPNETDKNEFYRLFLEDEIFEELNKFVDVTQAAEEELHGENRLICWIYNRDSGIFLGYCCIDNISNELPEIGIKLLKTVQNKGFGTRALRLLTQMFSQKTGVNIFRSRVVSDNYACQHVMDKLGAAFVGLSTVIEDTSEVSQTYLRKLEAMFSEEDDEKLTNVAAKYNVDPKMLFSHNLEFIAHQLNKAAS